MLNFKNIVVYTGIGTAGFAASNLLTILADMGIKHIPVDMLKSGMMMKIARALIIVTGGGYLLTKIQQGGMLVGGFIPPEIRRNDAYFAAFVGAWGPATFLPIAKDLGFPLANAGDFEKFLDAVITGKGLIKGSDMEGVRAAVKIGLANAGKSPEAIAQLDGISFEEIASQLNEALPQLNEALAQVRNSIPG